MRLEGTIIMTNLKPINKKTKMFLQDLSINGFVGNLNQRNYDQLPDVNIRVEYYRIAKLANGEYEIEVKKLI